LRGVRWSPPQARAGEDRGGIDAEPAKQTTGLYLIAGHSSRSR
jgi:hypothetical protein